MTASASTSAASSRLPGESAPMARTSVPSLRSAAESRGDCDGVQVTTTSACAAAEAGVSWTWMDTDLSASWRARGGERAGRGVSR
jgi:hypothetical protein